MLICRALFRNDKGHIYVVSDEKLEQIFDVFDKNEDGFIDRNEFQFCWNHWIKTVSGNFMEEKKICFEFRYLQLLSKRKKIFLDFFRKIKKNSLQKTF